MKKKRKKYLLCLILLVLILASITILLRGRKVKLEGDKVDKTLSVNSKDIDTSYKQSYNDEYTEIYGYGELNLNKDNPYIKLINPSENKDCLCFDVYYQDKLLYSSKLIEPGKMEEFNVYNQFSKGSYTLEYHISSYDIVSKTPMLSGIIQRQDIIIN